MQLLKNINEQITRDENLLDEHLASFFDQKDVLITENIATFLDDAKELVNGLERAAQNSTFTDTTQLDNFIKTLAGLEYFRQKSVGVAERNMLSDIDDDEKVNEYIKNTTITKAENIVDEIKTHFHQGKIVRRNGIDKMINDIEKFYITKRANVGTLLHVASFKDI